ncbi:MAG: galactonate dehydratase [Maribacter sp.]
MKRTQFLEKINPLAGNALKDISLANVKIEAVEAFLLKRALFVKITADNGVSGWGEASNKFPRTTIELTTKEMGKRIIGMRPFDTEPIWNLLFFKAIDSGPNGIMLGAMAGIDNALWDLKGQLLQKPVYELLGGPYTTKIKAYASFGRGSSEPMSPLECAKQAETFVDQGYRAVKIRMQIRQLNINPNPDPSEETVKAIRDAIGYDIPLFYDANNGYSPYRAIQIGKKLYEKYDIASMEEPVAEHNFKAIAQVSEALDVPVTAGEHEFTRWMFRDLITIGKVDIINPDFFKSGGVTEGRKIASLASAFSIPVMCHNVRPTLATAAAYHIIASIHNRSEFQEYGGEHKEWGLQKYFKNNLLLKNGHVELSNEPGFGLVPDEKAIERDAIKFKS